MDLEKVKMIYDILIKQWPDQGTALVYNNCFELLVSVMLSAQCTDEQVNKVTPKLFAAYKEPKDLASANKAEVEAIIYSTGFFRTKAANIIAASEMLCLSHNSVVPDTIETLITLPGVGRKTANLVVSLCYGKPGIVVDTHVKRIANRLGLADSPDPTKIEYDIGGAIDSSLWTGFSFALNRHGKYVCASRRPQCHVCGLVKLCRFWLQANGSGSG